MRLTPQQKKALSYARDRRNDFGENYAASLRGVRLNKRHNNRSDRHRHRRLLINAAGLDVTAEQAERAELALLGRKSTWDVKGWRKWRDAPLGDVVVRQLGRRARLGIATPGSVRVRIDRIRRRLGAIEPPASAPGYKHIPLADDDS